MSCIVGNAVAFVVKTGRCFRRTRGGRGHDKTEDKTQDRQRDQEPHGLLPFSGMASRQALLYRGLNSGSRREKIRTHTIRSAFSPPRQWWTGWFISDAAIRIFTRWTRTPGRRNGRLGPTVRG